MQVIQDEDVVATQAEPESVCVVAVDSRSERRGVIRNLLERSFEPGEIAEADSKAAAVELVERCRPDLVLLEIQMPLEEGLDTIEAVRLISPRPRIVVCSFRQDAATIQGALDRGADAYLAKPTSPSALRAAFGPLPAEHAARRRPPNERPVSPAPPAATPVPAGTSEFAEPKGVA